VRHLVALDAAAFDVLDQPAGAGLRALLRTSVQRGGDVVCAAVTLAEVCRTTARARQVEVSLRRDRGGERIRVVATDERLAKTVGRLLGDAGLDSCHLADAHVVALCRDVDRAVVVTADPDDVARLAACLPGVRIVTRRPV
jgi:predicted nucleic acid-binding protein